MNRLRNEANRIACAAVLLALALASCRHRAEEPTPKEGESKSPPTVKLQTAVAREEPLAISASGTFIAADSSVLTPAVEGLVVKTPFFVGDFVERGAAVILLEREGPSLRLREAEGREREAVATLAQAEARLGSVGNDGANYSNLPEVQAAQAALDLALAELRLARTEDVRAANLLKSGDVSRSNYERARATLHGAEAREASARQQLESARNTARQTAGAVDAARASLAAVRAQTALARKALADTAVRAPFAGFLSERSVSTGEYVGTASKVGRLERIQPVKLQLQVPESEAARVALDQLVRASTPALGVETFTGKITSVNASLNSASRTLLVEATFPNPANRLKPGMFATAAIRLSATEERIVVSESAIQQDTRTDTFRAWIVENGKARLRIVQPDRKEGQSWLIVSGLRAGDNVIVGNTSAELFEGAEVTIAQPNTRIETHAKAR